MSIQTLLQAPKTVSRSKALIDIYGTEGGYDPAGGYTLNNLIYIGGITKLMLPIERGAAEFRELNATNFGRIIEQVPGLVSFDNVSLRSVVTYKGTFMERCGFQGHVLDYQSYPMLFLLDLPTPNAARYPARQLIIEGAVFLNNPLEWSVEEKEDLRIVQDIRLAISNIREFIL